MEVWPVAGQQNKVAMTGTPMVAAANGSDAVRVGTI
jgi:hypothetical protein